MAMRKGNNILWGTAFKVRSVKKQSFNIVFFHFFQSDTNLFGNFGRF